VKQFQQTESNHPYANQIDRDHQVQQPRHYQDKNASDQRKDSWNMNGRDVHAFLQMRPVAISNQDDFILPQPKVLP
jgi:hypothetical protein